jgi:phosphate/sulfate permease
LPIRSPTVTTVSTTHILSSGVAGTMAANGSGLQWSTVRNIAAACVGGLIPVDPAVLSAGPTGPSEHVPQHRVEQAGEHILSSGVAGTMAANGSGLQWSTVRNIAAAWLLTLQNTCRSTA